MKKLNSKTVFKYLIIFSTIFLSFYLLFSSLGYKRESPDIKQIIFVDHVKASVNGGPWEDITLPHRFHNLEPGSDVSLKSTVTPKKDDSIYIKSIYSKANVYIDDKLFFVFGKDSNYPKYMVDPAIEIHSIETYGDNTPVELRIDFTSPESIDFLSVEPPMIGNSKEIILDRYSKYGTSFLFAVIQVTLGITLLLISCFVLFINNTGKLFIWLGSFSIATGLWYLGSNNFAITIIPSTTFLYVVSYTGFMSFLIPLIEFIKEFIDFKNTRVLNLLKRILNLALIAFLFLQVTGFFPLYKSISFYRYMLPAGFIIISVCVIAEYILYKNERAKRLILPTSILSIGLIGEIIHMITDADKVHFPILQSCILLFMLLLAIDSSRHTKDELQLQHLHEKLEHEQQMLDILTAEQRESRILLANNEKLLSRQRHDLRHHIAVIQELSDKNDTELQEYLNTISEKIPAPKKRFCENNVVNAIVLHYAFICDKIGCNFTCELSVPETNSAKLDSDLCVIFANLLENGTEACKRMTSRNRYITIKSRYKNSILSITMDNSFEGNINIEDKRYISSKRNDYGIGIGSIQSIAKNYNGEAEFKNKDNVFYSSIYINIYPYDVK